MKSETNLILHVFGGEKVHIFIRPVVISKVLTFLRHSWNHIFIYKYVKFVGMFISSQNLFIFITAQYLQEIEVFLIFLLRKNIFKEMLSTFVHLRFDSHGKIVMREHKKMIKWNSIIHLLWNIDNDVLKIIYFLLP